MIDHSKIAGYIGKPWVYGENDCWAVFCRASHDLFGVRVKVFDIPPAPDLSVTISAFECGAKSREWERIFSPEPGCAVLFRNYRGHAVHIGLYVDDGNVLHCGGGVSRMGSTLYEKLSDIMRIFKTCEFYRYAENHNSK